MKLFFRYITPALLFYFGAILPFMGQSALAGQDEYVAAVSPAASSDLPLKPTDAADICIVGAQQIRIHIIGSYKKGLIKVELYKSDDGFLQKKGRLKKFRVAAEDGPMTICMDVDASGRYAVAGYHDLNANRKLDKNWNYSPKEPFVLSNNPNIKTLRMPKFEECAFDVGLGGADIELDFVDPPKK